jgi:hypothetical protein
MTTDNHDFHNLPTIPLAHGPPCIPAEALGEYEEYITKLFGYDKVSSASLKLLVLQLRQYMHELTQMVVWLGCPPCRSCQ